jgi:polar amino acid transport system substrate-binding protein
MRKILLPVGLFVTLILTLSVACANRESTWDRVQRNGVLRVGLDPTYPPFEFYDGDSLYGLDVDLANAIAAEKGLTVEFSHFGFDGLYDALATEQVDILISALSPDLSRTRDFAYSDGYIESGLVLVSPATQPVRQVASLTGRRVAVELGAAGHVQATTWQRQLQDLAISTFNSSDEALQALASGQSDAAVVDNITYRLFEPSAGNVDFVVAPIDSQPYAIVVRRDDGQLLAEINDALATLRDSGRLDSILNSWLPG